jgi:hypothetical protein
MIIFRQIEKGKDRVNKNDNQSQAKGQGQLVKVLSNRQDHVFEHRISLNYVK